MALNYLLIVLTTISFQFFQLNTCEQHSPFLYWLWGTESCQRFVQKTMQEFR